MSIKKSIISFLSTVVFCFAMGGCEGEDSEMLDTQLMNGKGDGTSEMFLYMPQITRYSLRKINDSSQYNGMVMATINYAVPEWDGLQDTSIYGLKTRLEEPQQTIALGQSRPNTTDQLQLSLSFGLSYTNVQDENDTTFFNKLRNVKTAVMRLIFPKESPLSNLEQADLENITIMQGNQGKFFILTNADQNISKSADIEWSNDKFEECTPWVNGISACYRNGSWVFRNRIVDTPASPTCSVASNGQKYCAYRNGDSWVFSARL